MSVLACCTTRDGDKNKESTVALEIRNVCGKRANVIKFRKMLIIMSCMTAANRNQIFSEQLRVCLEQIRCLSHFKSHRPEDVTVTQKDAIKFGCRNIWSPVLQTTNSCAIGRFYFSTLYCRQIYRHGKFYLKEIQ